MGSRELLCSRFTTGSKYTIRTSSQNDRLLNFIFIIPSLSKYLGYHAPSASASISLDSLNVNRNYFSRQQLLLALRERFKGPITHNYQFILSLEHECISCKVTYLLFAQLQNLQIGTQKGFSHFLCLIWVVNARETDSTAFFTDPHHYIRMIYQLSLSIDCAISSEETRLIPIFMAKLKS